MGLTKFKSPTTDPITCYSILAESDIVTAGAVVGSVKTFQIDHPTKPGLVLRHGSLEGPEHAVYIRGKIENSDSIILPEYWNQLVNFDTITVNITPIGEYQQVFISKIENGIVYLGGVVKNAHFIIFAERIDVEKLVVES